MTCDPIPIEVSLLGVTQQITSLGLVSIHTSRARQIPQQMLPKLNNNTVIIFFLSLLENSENLSEMRQARSKLFLRAQRRTVRMAVAIFTVFAINWLPYAFFSLWYVWFPVPLDHMYVFEVAFMFGLSNSCFNPLIYGACNVRYCHKICACLGFRSSAKSGVETSHSDRSNKTTMYSVRWQSSKAGNNTKLGGKNNNKDNSWTKGTATVPPEKQQMITTTT